MERDGDLEREYQIYSSICEVVKAREERKDKTADTNTILPLLYEGLERWTVHRKLWMFWY